MNFEDFNYNHFNQFILIDPNKMPEYDMDSDDSENGEMEKKPLLGFCIDKNHEVN